MRIPASLCALFLVACKDAPITVAYQAVPVGKRNIIVSARAAGVVQPDTVVEVKSKASGEILDMKVETGQVVKRGTLMVLVDQRTPRNTLSQAEAQLEVAKARLANSEAQKKRSDDLFKSQSITEQEHDSAVLAVANARADVVSAEVAVENARISMEDTSVLAPITGTVISKSVERGQVISSPTRDVGGGTVLLKMADLSLVQVRTLVDETDIGKIKPGLRVTVTVNAYPNQPFEGEVMKVEPQAETQNNVTMFPVMVRIQNQNGLLKPGMNTDVEIHVGKRDSVFAIPNAALRTPRDVNSAAQVLGIADNDLQQGLKAAEAKRDAARNGSTESSSTDPSKSHTPVKPAGNTMTTPDGRVVPLPAGVTEEQVRALFRKAFGGGQLTPAEAATMAQVRQSFGGGGRGGAPKAQSNDFQFGGNYIVFVSRGGRPTPTYVRTGLTDLDYSEVVTGLTPNDSVLILPSAGLVQSQQEFKKRITNMTGGGAVPGMQKTPAAGATTARPPATGGARP